MDKFTFSAELMNLAAMRQFLRDHLQGVPNEVSDDVLLAVNEAVTNIMVHGYKNSEEQIELFFENSDDIVSIWLYDNAPPFDPTTYISPNLNLPLKDRPYGKMGIFLIFNLMDEVRYRRMSDNRNELILKKEFQQSDHGH
jgi:serine/threonine-protein kinase RsbW